MIVRLKLLPGQKGTKALVDKYGDDLVCVRYRYDKAGHSRIKTVELIVERKELTPVEHITPDDVIVALHIGYGEQELRKLSKSLGGTWDAQVKLWHIKYGMIKGTELEKHIILDAEHKTLPA